MRFRISAPSASLRYVLHLGPADQGAIADTLAQYAFMINVLEQTATREGIRSDVVRLQKLAYERIRSQTELPAQMVFSASVISQPGEPQGRNCRASPSTKSS